MGYIKHNALIVQGYDDYVFTAYKIAKTVFGNLEADGMIFSIPISGIETSPMNNYSFFVVFPDGSKEGWAHSDAGDAARKEFKVKMEQFDWHVDWHDIRFGGDDDLDIIERKNPEE